MVDRADRLVPHPGGRLPEKWHDPNALRRCYELNLRDLSRRPACATQAAAEIVALEYVTVLSSWRFGSSRPLTVREFVQALGRLGGHQNRQGDGTPGWLVLWRGWMKLQLLREGYQAGRRAERAQSQERHKADDPGG